MPDASASPESQRAERQRRHPVLRIAPLIVGIGGALLLSHLYGARQVELLLVLPSETVESEAPEIRAMEVRVLRASDDVQVARARRPRTGDGRTVVMPVRVPRGEFRLEAWTIGPSEPERFEAVFRYSGEDVIEVPLEPSG